MKNLMLAILFIAALFTSQSYSEEVYTDNVVIVLDASGSMNDSMRDAQGNRVRKIDAAKTALHEVLKQVPPTTHIGLLVFSSTKGDGLWFYELGPRDDAKLKQAIDSIEPSDGTPLGTYMKVGADKLLQVREKQHNYGSYRLLVVTDGEANNERGSLVDNYTKDIISRGITVDVIGVMMKAKHTLATKVHSYRSANDPASFTKAVQEVFSEISVKDKSVFEGSEFDDLSGISPEVAMVIIETLSKTGNHPIGEKPPQPRVQKTEQGADSQSVDQNQQSAKGSEIPCVWIAIIVIVVIAIIGGFAKLFSNY